MLLLLLLRVRLGWVGHLVRVSPWRMRGRRCGQRRTTVEVLRVVGRRGRSIAVATLLVAIPGRRMRWRVAAGRRRRPLLTVVGLLMRGVSLVFGRVVGGIRRMLPMRAWLERMWMV